MIETIKQRFQRLREEQANLRREVKERTIGYIVAALGLVAGLAWNEAIKSLIDQFFPHPENDVFIKFIYAILVTVLVVVVTVYLIRFIQKEEAK